VSDRCAWQRLLDADRQLLVLMRTTGHSPGAERAAAAYSKLGEHAAVWIGLGLAGALVDRRHRSQWLGGCSAVVAAYGLNFAVKVTVRRRRPVLEDLPPLTSTVSRLSFPSAHSTTSFAAAAAYRGLVPGGALYGMAVAFALTRPYLGVHYPSDVVTGAVLGTVLGRAARQRLPVADGGGALASGGTPCP
jgi:membrane-associated phospholipid phosphatase